MRVIWPIPEDTQAQHESTLKQKVIDTFTGTLARHRQACDMLLEEVGA